jgi:hypothetical protein
VIATLDSNMQLFLWTSVKNHLRGEWSKVRYLDSGVGMYQLTCIQLVDVTQYLKETLALHEFPSPTARTLQLQVTCGQDQNRDSHFSISLMFR